MVSVLKSAAIPLTNFVWRKPLGIFIRTTNRFQMSCFIYIEKELKTLKRNKSAGLDILPPGMLKACAGNILKPICFTINLSITTGQPICFTIYLSITTGQVPQIWKTAKVTPIHKSGSTPLLGNFRPISVLPTLSKMLEKVVHSQLILYLENNNLINTNQFGYRTKRSTKLAATLFTDYIRREIDNGRLVGAVFINLTKAFDTISHGALLEKLPAYGINGNELIWITDYLFQRQQLIRLG